jgi:diaminopimelate epimerase
LETAAGLVTCEVKKPNYVRVQMPNPQWIKKELKTPFWKNSVAWLNTGVPHLVVEVNSEKELKNFTEEAEKMRAWDGLGPGGANVTFIHFSSDKKLAAVTFERGVEGYTLACGTGAVAAAMYAMEKNKTTECLVSMPGGNLLIKNEKNKIYMEGEAWRVADIHVPTSLVS